MELKNQHALILGVSSGFGKATAQQLAGEGYHIYGLHLDRGTARSEAEAFAEELRGYGVDVKFFNMNAADDKNRAEVVGQIKEDLAKTGYPLKLLLHSLAFGKIGAFFAKDDKLVVDRRSMEMTMNVMANSLLFWAQELYHADLLGKGSRIIALTSAGSQGVMKNYGAMSVAKAAIESYIRQIAYELAPLGVTANSLMPGTTDTPAGRAIPGFENMLEYAKQLNPFQRNTLPEDIARIIALLLDERSEWISGQVIGTDGGESVIKYAGCNCNK